MQQHLSIAALVFAHVLALLAGALITGAAAQPDNDCLPYGPDDPEFTTAIIWTGSGPDLQLHDIATLAAPVLWFSSDEPLILKGDIPAPHAHPCDAPAEGAVVYYQVTKIHLRGAEEVTIPEKDDPDFFSKVDDFTIRYYFYFHEDIGLNPHTHDLELTEFEIALEQTEGGCYQVRIVSVTSFAHGTDWYNNELRLEKDTKMPVTLFVEEGKHATCPDRNADGVYTPGYDVNMRINDAWGVRDVFGAGWLISASYSASMTKPRDRRFMVLPPRSPHAREVHPFISSLRDVPEDQPRYELRAANTVVMCDDVPPHREFLLEMMTRHRFGEGNEPVQYASGSIKKLTEPLVGTSGWKPSIALRWDRAIGFAFYLSGIPIESNYLVPRITWIIDNSQWSFEAMGSSSASRWAGGYVSVGAAYERDWYRDDQGNIIVASHNEWNFVTETGVKFRFRLTGKIRVLTLGNSFGGIRLGVRFSGFDSLKNGRLIAEIGTGVW